MRSTYLALLLLALACDTLEPDRGGPALEGIRVTDEGNGVYRLEVDASDKEAWVYFDLDARTSVDAPADLSTSLEWDLAFRRFFVKSNGGVSGPAGVRVAPLPNVAFDALEQAPETGWIEDRPKAADGSDAPDEVIRDDVDFTFNRANDASENGWYLYDPTDHTLSPAPVVFAIESKLGDFYKLELLRYYDDAGSPGFLTLRFAAIEGMAL